MFFAKHNNIQVYLGKYKSLQQVTVGHVWLRVWISPLRYLMWWPTFKRIKGNNLFLYQKIFFGIQFWEFKPVSQEAWLNTKGISSIWSPCPEECPDHVGLKQRNRTIFWTFFPSTSWLSHAPAQHSVAHQQEGPIPSGVLSSMPRTSTSRWTWASRNLPNPSTSRWMWADRSTSYTQPWLGWIGQGPSSGFKVTATERKN